MRKSLRWLLFPFSVLYGSAVYVRNFLFDKKILQSVTFHLPIICVGNLSVGGTGKTPMVEYLVQLLQNKYELGTISRGYKRKTRGYYLADAKTTAMELGDEPFQFHRKFPKISVAVGEERIIAVPHLLQDRPNTQVIILDDAFQHRWIKAGFNILLTAFDSLFTNDFLLPAGNLRDQRSSSGRAEVIVVTKCPPELSLSEKKTIAEKISFGNGRSIYFTTLQYGELYHFSTGKTNVFKLNDEVLVVSGIANPKPFIQHIALNTKKTYPLIFSDHHLFSNKDADTIRNKFDEIKAENKIIVTTEKDAAKLIQFEDSLQQLPLYVLPVKHQFLFDEGIQFDYLVTNFITRFYETNNDYE